MAAPRPIDVPGWPDPLYIKRENQPGPLTDATVTLATIVRTIEKWVDTGQSHSALATRSKVPRTTWNSIRQGTTWPRLDTLVPLCRAVGIAEIVLGAVTVETGGFVADGGYGPAGEQCNDCLNYLKEQFGTTSWENVPYGDLVEAVSRVHGNQWNVRCTAIDKLRERGGTPENIFKE